MKFSLTMDIDVPRQRVIELFDNPENLPRWQPDLLSFEPLSGEPGQPGATSRLRYRMGKKEVEMIETITARNLPNEFSGTYEADGMLNIVENRFAEVEANRTRWDVETEFRCSGWTRLLGFLMPGMFKKETLKYMRLFKDFAEGETAQ